jgi:hydrogenase-1 operon protein HyaE
MTSSTLNDMPPAAAGEEMIRLNVAGPQHPGTSPLVERLATVHGATWLDASSLDAWSREGGNRVVLFAGDPVRFPEGQDVAVVLPELRRSVAGGFAIGILPRHLEESVAQRYGVQRWPSLLFLRDGLYVATVPGMLDWEVYLKEVTQALARPTSRTPGIGIALVSAGQQPSSCH